MSAASAETLQDALVSAYVSNPQLQAERRQLEVTNEQVPQALANWRPTVTINGQAGKEGSRVEQACDVTPTPCSSGTFIPFPKANGSNVSNQKVLTSSYGVTVAEPLFRGGRTVAQTAQALNLVNAERAHLASTEQTVLYTVVMDYLSVTEQSSILDLNINNEQVLKRQLAAENDRYKLGELTHTDVRLAEAAYAQAIASREAAQGQLDVARAAYEHDVGHAAAGIAAPTIMPELPATKDEAVSIASAAAPSVIEAQYTQKAAENDIDLIRGQLLPTITLQGSYTRAYNPGVTPGQRADDKSVIAQASMPIYEGGSIYSQSRAAQKTVSVRKNQVDDARRAAIQLAASVWDALKATRDQIVADQQAVQANEYALSGLEQEEQVGTRTVQDVLIQQEALFQSRVALVTAQHDALLYQFDLAQSGGRLTARNLGLEVKNYDPEQEFDAVRDKWIGFGTGP